MKVMSYLPSESFDVDLFSNQKSFIKSENANAFSKLSTKDALALCAAPLMSDEKMFTSNFYQTFEGFLLSMSHKETIDFRCEKSCRQKEIIFRAENQDKLKKVDVFVNNRQFTQIAIKGDDKAKVKISEKVIEEDKRGDNLDSAIKTFTVEIFGMSYYNYNNNMCYDLDRKNVAKSYVTSSYTPSVSDNNSQFTFDVAVMAHEGPSGTMCAVYGVFPVPTEDDKFFI